MSLRLHPIEDELDRANLRWRTVRFVTHTATIASIITAVFLVVGLLATAGVLTSAAWAVVLLAFGIVGSAFAWAILTLIIWGSTIQRTRTAAAIERAHSSLLDRLNTITYLERTSPQSPLLPPIAAQTANVLKQTRPGPTCSTKRAWLHWGALAILAMVTIWFYRWAAPFERLHAAEAAAEAEAATNGLVLPPGADGQDEQALAEDKVWAEVQITQPGADIRAAEFETVPLQIEVSSSQPLTQVKLVTSVNGGLPSEQQFPAPEDPTFATYSSEIVLPTLNVNQWDVVSYYAEAIAGDGKSYKSDLYFIEVFPLREKLEQLPGGRQGSAYRLLQELTAITERQQDVVRSQHRLDQLPQREAARRQLGYEQLALDEQRLAKAVQRLSAAARVQWQQDADFEEWSEKLNQAANALRDAQQSLQQADESNDPRATEEALRQLVEARALLQALVRQFPDRFAGNGSPLAGGPAQPQSQPQLKPVPPPTAEQLQQAREQAQQLAQDQQELAARTHNEPLQPLAAEQQKVAEQLAQMPADHPEATSVVAEPFISTFESSADSQQKLKDGDPKAPEAAEYAAQQAQELAHQLQQHELVKQLADQISELKNIQEKPHEHDDAAMKKQAEDAQKLLDHLEQFAQECPNHSQQLQQQLNEPNEREALQSACKNLGNSQNDDEKASASAAAQQGFEKLAQSLSNDQAQAAASQHHEHLDRQLNTMKSQADGIQAARNEVRRMLSAERDLQRGSLGQQPGALQQLAGTQQQNQDAFQQAQQQHQQAMKQVPEEVQQAGDALSNATQAMRSGDAASSQQAQTAGDKLQNLDSALDQVQRFQSMSDAFRLQQQLERHLRHLQNLQQSPEKYSPEQFQQAAQDSQRLAAEAQRLGQSPGVKENLGDQLAGATGDQQIEQLQQASDELSNASANDGRQAALDKMRELLRSMNQAMGRQNSVGMRAGGDALRENGYQALARALREMESLARSPGEFGQLTAEQQDQLRRDASMQIAEAVSDIYGHNERSDQLVSQLHQNLVEQKTPVDQETIRQLMSEIQQLARENTLNEPENDEPEQLKNVDTSRLPPAYRRAIERYFQKLSEQK